MKVEGYLKSYKIFEKKKLSYLVLQNLTSSNNKSVNNSLIENYILPFGKAKIIQEGNILTIITWGAMVQKCIESVKACELEKDMVEIIDLRTLNPLDHETINSSVEKTGKALVVHEDNLTNGP